MSAGDEAVNRYFRVAVGCYFLAAACAVAPIVVAILLAVFAVFS